MKKVLFILGMLLSLGMFWACSSDDESENESPVILNELFPIVEEYYSTTVSNFFKTEFGTYEDEKPFDLKNNLSSEDNPCIVINNEEDFNEVYTGDLNLPTIDFSKYTLMIGKIYLTAGTFIDNMSIKQTNSSEATLFINCIIDTKEAHTCYMLWKYYWTLFPKFDASEINVEISQEYGEVDDSKK